jgi:hypothetical protein
LDEALAATAESRGGLMLLTGDAGIGKTRLAEAVAALASGRGLSAVWGRCWETGGAPAYWPWIEALRTLAAERGARALAAGAPAGAREAALLVPELAGHGEPQTRTADPDAARFALFDGVAEVLLAAARDRPLVLLLEDLHAADHTSLLLLDLLAPRLAGAPLLAVGTLRPHDPGTDSRAQDVLSRVGRRGEVLELSGLGVEATRALASASAVPQPAGAQPRAEARFAREGEAWLIEFGGQRTRLRDRKGIAYLARLLEQPHLEIAALELAGGQAETPQGDAGPMLDEEAKRAYRRRVDELRQEIDEAQRWNDPERAERASAELDLLGAELSRAVGLGGRNRRAASNAERARVSVTRAIRSAIEAIEDHHQELGSHLTASVRTGTHCRYAPAAGDEVAWRVERSSQAS